MKIKLNYLKNAQQNGNDYYNKAKKLLNKRNGAELAVQNLEKQLKHIEEKSAQEKRIIIKKSDKKWYEKFHWFYTSNNMLCIGGRSAQQNDLINAKYFLDDDIFFHADIFGASLVLLKDGVNAKNEIWNEAAHFAAIYSSAWKEDLSTVDVYALKRNQISKSTATGSVGAGGFVMKGEREWFKNTPLSLFMFNENNTLNAVPKITFDKLIETKKINVYVELSLGTRKKSDAAKIISKHLNFEDLDMIMQQLPAGLFRVQLSKSGKKE
ncbi:MAG: NFACT RNA binding domain-containing protein [Candidatus Marsarchaeota archaeon]|nr:NFACT RNA binding domain-containing protein [Candidatus Marsarchaeota archaeon]